jgi:SAM-dependent methyltransferase
MVSDRTKNEDTIRACYAGWSHSYHQDYYGPNAAYPPVHRNLLRKTLLTFGANNLIDAGCGPASFLRELADTSIALYGFDLTPEMVAEGKRIFTDLGLPPDRLWHGSVCDASAFADPAGELTGRFDAAVCAGVLPHIRPEDDTRVIANLYTAVRPGGMVLVEARNALFALFTLNRYSMDFFRQELIQPKKVLAGASTGERTAFDEGLKQLQSLFRMDQPPVRRGAACEPGYDDVLSRTHNPFVLREQFAAQGFDDVNILFYHFHCLPPMLESHMPELFRRKSLEMEDPHDWRGHFMASAFIVVGVRR